MKNDKLIKKKFVVAAVLLMVYAAFLVQQVMLSQVLCYKADGSVDLEAAYWGIQCECKDKNHNHIHKNVNHSGDGEKNGMGVEAECCFDVPVNTGLLTNESNSIFPDTTLVELYNVHGAGKTLLSDPYTGLPEQIPLSKFIILSPFQCCTVIMRC